ncbi:class I SAM-dependent methyltransferase [Roseovarius sp. A21]|uniref:Class I SAM-dependent methyltransferase n=1 Tax=Roseovarius bejariae TaxID=2576383 RepID=A0A844D4B6_9RHOB|nr:methyltransferase domain-containing protein [Roseovarius bejariae]MRU16693.1 class I SAM-dependent methyltransferase [Roseovarius bejariae]
MSFHQHVPGGFLDSEVNLMANRVQARHAMLVDVFRHIIADSTVMLLGAEDGRWCYTFAAAGALQVVGVESSFDLVERFSRLPDVGMRERIEMRYATPVEELYKDAEAGRTYDVVVLFDVLENVSDLYELLHHIAAVSPRLVVIDGLFAVTEEAVLMIERHRGPVHDGVKQQRLIPSRGAITLAAEDTGFAVDWVDWRQIPEDSRLGLSDYYQSGAQRRFSLILTPNEDD